MTVTDKHASLILKQVYYTWEVLKLWILEVYINLNVKSLYNIFKTILHLKEQTSWNWYFKVLQIIKSNLWCYMVVVQPLKS